MGDGVGCVGRVGGCSKSVYAEANDDVMRKRRVSYYRLLEGRAASERDPPKHAGLHSAGVFDERERVLCVSEANALLSLFAPPRKHITFT